MMRASAFALLAAPALLAAASAPLPRQSPEQHLALAEREARAAAARVRQLEVLERKASDAAAKLAIERQRAAAEIALAEARIATADVGLAQARAAVAARERQLAQRRAPLAALLAGLATMGRRPPILTLADGASIGEVVRVRALVDSTMPLIARRSAVLQAELAGGRRLAKRATAARREVAERRADLAAKLAQFTTFEHRALAQAEALRRTGFGEQDAVIAGGEDLLDLRGAARQAAAARALARELARLPLSPPRPFAAEGKPWQAPLDYRLPASAAVIEGLGTVSAAGVRSRGIRLATPRGAPILAPAAGKVLFAGAYREHDGLVVIDHGRGWSSLLIGVAPAVRRGERVAIGASIGRALGDIALELRERGQPRSPALIAGSSGLLSNADKIR